MKTVRSKGGKLQLAKETLRSLSGSELDSVHGGTGSGTASIVFQTAACPISGGARICGSINGTGTGGSASRLLLGCGGSSIVIGTLPIGE